jgi:molybdopterin-guanine dinucleotide biosynthesis protein A
MYPDLEAVAVWDKLSGGGPTLGIHAALEASSETWVLAVACDMPLITADALERLLPGSAESVDVVVASDGQRLHPTCACYHRRFLETIRETHERGILSLTEAVERTLYRAVPLPPEVLTNVNFEYDIPASQQQV